MRIAIYSDFFYPELSGITDSIMTTAKELAKMGHFINFYVPYYGTKSYEMLGFEKKEIFLHENIKIIRLLSFYFPTGTKQSRLVIPTGHRTFLAKKFKPEIIHTHVIAGVGIEGLIDSRLLNIPLVGTNHTPIVEFLKYIPLKSKILNKFISRFDSWYYNQCKFVSAPSGTIFEEMEQFGFKAPHKVMSNPLDTQTFKPVDSDTKKALKKKFGFSDFCLLYTGRLAQEKNIDLTIKAVARLKKRIPQINFVITGKGNAENSLKDLAKDLGIVENVKFMGFIKDNREYAQIYNACDLFVIPSTCETQSIAAMQAMACKIPVIGARAWGLKEYINSQNGMLIEPEDLDELVNDIELLQKDQNLRNKLGEGARKFVEDFSAPNIAKKWEGIYLKVLEKGV